jgi:hypothetical protein
LVGVDYFDVPTLEIWLAFAQPMKGLWVSYPSDESAKTLHAFTLRS